MKLKLEGSLDKLMGDNVTSAFEFQCFLYLSDIIVQPRFIFIDSDCCKERQRSLKCNRIRAPKKRLKSIMLAADF
jgi:hypothetical protein